MHAQQQQQQQLCDNSDKWHKQETKDKKKNVKSEEWLWKAHN